MKKIALCLFGSIGFKEKPKKNSDDIIDPTFCNKFFEKNLIKNNNVDIFFHTWDSIYNKKVADLYKPKSFSIEKHLNFKINLKEYSLEFINFYEEISEQKYYNQTPEQYIKNFIFRTKSRWHSQIKSLELMKKYKEENNINYDFIIQSRFDLIISKLNLTTLDKDFVHLVNAPHQNIDQLHDLIFISNYENAIQFIDIKSNLNNYPICPTNTLPIFFKERKIKFQKSLNLRDFTIFRYYQKYKNISFLRKTFNFIIARFINIISFLLIPLKKGKIYLNNLIN